MTTYTSRLIALIHWLTKRLVGYMQGTGATPREIAQLQRHVDQVIRGEQ